ncbi:hypothetical protein E4U60_001063 [Claviceps pazoutovae]|uniref:Uncharacterized protein n=1 Tax=Claviceps pazoutovae TaxID=1649127 RepID=A0A9P7MJS1_9HYPO|nr:hypothetical protein E4U60_001063 [Claviceps pazoutovae]
MPPQPLQPPAHLRELVQARFAKALAVGDLHYYATQATLLRVGQAHFQLRFSPALAKKSAGKSQPSSSSPPSHSQSIVDPFAHPSPSLFLSDVGDAHYLVLNKFAVVSGHFILATRAFRPQNHVLEEADLEATTACIKAYGQHQGQLKEAGHEHDGLFAFFNSGEHSGASQPHRHLQFLPVDQMREGLGSEESSWGVLASQGPEAEKQLPFRVFSEEIRLDMAASEVHEVYLRLYRRACRAVRLMREEKDNQKVNDEKNDAGRTDGGIDAAGASVDDVPEKGPALISYNLGVTSTRMVLCPRLAEGGPVLDQEGHEVGRLSLNGTLLAGTALVKNTIEWDMLRGEPSGLVDVLRRIGIPKD